MYRWDWSGAVSSAGYWVAFAVILVIGILIQFFFLFNLRNLLKEVSPQNRAMQPDMVWLNFIPLWSLGWVFYTVIKVRDSVQAEFRTRGWAQTDDLGYGVGMAYAVLAIVSAFIGGVIWFGGLLSLAALVCWIIYWVKTARLKNHLMVGGVASGQVQPSQYPGHRGYGTPGGQGPQSRCSSCGAVADPGDEYCRSCGQRVDTSGGAQYSATQGTGGAGPGAPDLGAEDYSGQYLSGPGPSAESTDAQAGGEPGEPDAATCPFCGATYRPKARFCASCGRPVV